MPNLSYHGGKVLTNVQTTALFLPQADTDWSIANLSSSDIPHTIDDFCSSYTQQMPSLLGEYGVPGMPIGPGNHTGSLIHQQEIGSSIDDGQIKDIIKQEIANGRIAKNPNMFPVVFVPSNVTITNSFRTSQNYSSGLSFGGYHDFLTDSDGTKIPYAVVSGANGKAAGHEIDEGVTSPFWDGWKLNNTSPPNMIEVADPCVGDNGPLLNGQETPEIWSNARNACEPGGEAGVWLTPPTETPSLTAFTPSSTAFTPSAPSEPTSIPSKTASLPPGSFTTKPGSSNASSLEPPLELMSLALFAASLPTVKIMVKKVASLFQNADSSDVFNVEKNARTPAAQRSDADTRSSHR